MNTLFGNHDRYEKIIDIICSYKGIERDELMKVLKDKECKYLMFLLMKKYKCTDIDLLSKDFLIDNKKKINYNVKKAEEKFLINKEFRDKYFETEEMISKTI